MTVQGSCQDLGLFELLKESLGFITHSELLQEGHQHGRQETGTYCQPYHWINFLLRMFPKYHKLNDSKQQRFTIFRFWKLEF